MKFIILMGGIKIFYWIFSAINVLIESMGTTATIKKEDGQLYIELTEDIVDIIPVDDVKFQIEDVIAHFIGCDT